MNAILEPLSHITPLPLPDSQAADLLLSYLKQVGVAYLFGIPGGAIEPLYNALGRSAREEGGVRAITARHESGAGFMADGYARTSGKLGVCCSTTGPGATNLVTAVANAYKDEIPLLVITAQASTSTFGKNAFQDSSSDGIDTVAILRPCTRYSGLVQSAEVLELSVIKAIMRAFQHPRGPVHLSIPLEVLSAPITSQPQYDLARLLQGNATVDLAAVERVLQRVHSARKVVAVIGPGCNNAMGHIIEFCRRFNADVITTPHAKGLVNSYDPQYRGVFGFAGHHAARVALCHPEVDCILAIGMEFDELSTDGWDDALLNAKLIHIDVVEQHFLGSPMAELHVLGDIATVFAHLATCTRRPVAANTEPMTVSTAQILPLPPLAITPPTLPFSMDENSKYHSASSPIKPQRLMRDLPRLFPVGTRFFADTGASYYWATHYLHPVERRGNGYRQDINPLLRTSMAYASMGWAIGAAIGAALAQRQGTVVCITGDGSLLMNGQEITVAREHNLNVVFVILNDAALGTVKHSQRLRGAEQIACDLPTVDYCAYAEAMGVRAYSIRSPEDLQRIGILQPAQEEGPFLLDVHIDRSELPPLGKRLWVLDMATHKTPRSARRYGR